MAKAGRKPKPTALKLLEGTRKDRVNPSEPPRLDGEPEVPSFLDGEARAEWSRMVANLRKLGILSVAHAPTLALYCQQYSRLVKAEAEIAKQGETITGAHGGVALNPYVRIAQDCSNFCARALSEFGLSPSSSSRITSTATAPDDELEEFLKRG
jgi:P27 family predicted phage terminase small subunit